MKSNDRHLHQHPSRFRAAFTLIELMVSVAILVLIILSVGVVFQSASKSVGLSQATLEMLANVRACQQQMERDVAGMDKNSFLLVRSLLDPATTTRRFDQIAFISNGTFSSKTGSSSAASVFNNPISANSAHIWFGQLAIEATPAPAAGNYLTANQNTAVPRTAVPSGVNDGDFILGRHATLLLPSPGGGSGTKNATAGSISAQAYAASTVAPLEPAFRWGTAVQTAFSPETAADITKSRIDIAVGTPSQAMQQITQFLISNGGRSTNTTYEIDKFCYRFAALRSVYDSEPAADTTFPQLNGYFRTTPIFLQGVPSFTVEWTDGTNTAGTLNWYGLGNTKTATDSTYKDTVEPSVPSSGDGYQAMFSFDTRAKWPKALKFTYHVSDPTGRIPAGRDFVQVVKIPD